MLTVKSVIAAQEIIKTWHLAHESIAFVPTMGNLHEGHLQLVKVAKTTAARVVVSIFVNPTQFGAGEDFENYPRTEQQDQEKLAEMDVDLVFLPSASEIYSSNAQTIVSVTGISEQYCGASRPGHFNGVATVVCKLFNIIQPTIALFGLKDFQQFFIIQRLVSDLNMPIQLIGVETVRESSGLALSSRNAYLSAEEKNSAPLLYQALKTAQAAIFANSASYTDIEQHTLRFLQEAGFNPDYFAICRSHDLQRATQDDSELVLLIAARLGKTRLIDNLRFTKPTKLS